MVEIKNVEIVYIYEVFLFLFLITIIFYLYEKILVKPVFSLASEQGERAI